MMFIAFVVFEIMRFLSANHLCKMRTSRNINKEKILIYLSYENKIFINNYFYIN